MKLFFNQLLTNIEVWSDEIKDVLDEVTTQACQHINDNEKILTYGKSDLITSFLSEAK